MLYTHIFNYFCIGTTFDSQDIRKQCLLPMCRIDANISIMIMTWLTSCIYHYLEMSQRADIRNLNSHLVKDYVNFKKHNIGKWFLKLEHPLKSHLLSKTNKWKVHRMIMCFHFNTFHIYCGSLPGFNADKLLYMVACR